MARRAGAVKERMKFTEEDGSSVILTFIPPTGVAYRRIGQKLYRFEGGKMLPNIGEVMDDLTAVALDSIIDVEGAEVEAGGQVFTISPNTAIFRPAAYNAVAGTKWATWKDALINTFPDYVRAVAELYYERARKWSDLPLTEEQRLEKNSAGTSGAPGPADVQTAAVDTEGTGASVGN